MLNLKKRLYKSKSKIFITILCIFGLLFSYSCSCKNRVSDPNETPINGGITNKKPDETPPGTFSMSAATDNVVTSIVKESGMVGDIKISFVSENNYDYTMDYTVEDSETDEAKKLTKADFQLANKVLTAKDSVANKVKLVDSSAGPVEKTITINFTFKANDASLKNNTQTLSVEVTLTHAQKVDGNNLQEILRKSQDIKGMEGSGPQEYKEYVFKTKEGVFDNVGAVFTIKNGSNDTLKVIKKSILRDFIDYALKNEYGATSGGSMVENSEEGGGENDDYYSVKYKFIFVDNYESNLDEITYRFEVQNGAKFVD